jgi:hypothetical protein
MWVDVESAWPLPWGHRASVRVTVWGRGKEFCTMIVSFTEIAILIILLFGLVGMMRGGRYVIATTAAVFFAMALVATSSAVFLSTANHLGLHLVKHSDRSLFLAFLFVGTILLVQSTITRVVPGLTLTRPKFRELSGAAKVWGFLIGLLNGFLIVATVVHYASPYLSENLATRTGGWAFSLPTLQFDHGQNWINLTIKPSTLVVMPSPLLGLYEQVPTALILLFVLLGFVFIGSLYGRMNRLRS